MMKMKEYYEIFTSQWMIFDQNKPNLNQNSLKFQSHYLQIKWIYLDYELIFIFSNQLMDSK